MFRSIRCAVLLFAIAALPAPLEDSRSNAPPEVATVSAPSVELTAPIVEQLVAVPLISVANLLDHIRPVTALAQAVQESAISADTAATVDDGRSALFWVSWLAVAVGVVVGGRYLWRKYMADTGDAYPRQRSS